MTLPNALEVFSFATEPVAALAMFRPEPTMDAPPEAMVGTVETRDGHPQWNTAAIHDNFVAFYEAFMRGERKVAPAILEEARVNPGEYIYVTDGRVAGGDVPFHDIIGWYKSDGEGRPVAASFEYNRKHRLVTEQGPTSMVVDPMLRRLVYPDHY